MATKAPWADYAGQLMPRRADMVPGKLYWFTDRGKDVDGDHIMAVEALDRHGRACYSAFTFNSTRPPGKIDFIRQIHNMQEDITHILADS